MVKLEINLFDILGHYKFWKFISLNFFEKLIKSGTISDFVAFLLSSYFLLWHAQKRNYQRRNEKGKKKFSHIFEKQFMKLHISCHLSTTKNIGEKVTARKLWQLMWANLHDPVGLSIPALVCHGATNNLVNFQRM